MDPFHYVSIFVVAIIALKRDNLVPPALMQAVCWHGVWREGVGRNVVLCTMERGGGVSTVCTTLNTATK